MQLRVDVSFAIVVDAETVSDAIQIAADMDLPANYIEDTFEATVDDTERAYIAERKEASVANISVANRFVFAFEVATRLIEAGRMDDAIICIRYGTHLHPEMLYMDEFTSMCRGPLGDYVAASRSEIFKLPPERMREVVFAILRELYPDATAVRSRGDAESDARHNGRTAADPFCPRIDRRGKQPRSRGCAGFDIARPLWRFPL